MHRFNYVDNTEFCFLIIAVLFSTIETEAVQIKDIVLLTLMLMASSLYSQDLLGPKHILQNIDNEGPISTFIVDIDNDGRQDILTSSAFDNKISWFKNLDGLGTFSEPRIIIESTFDIFTINIADVDLDGNIDILASAENNNRCYWIRNLGNNGKFDNPKVINYQINDPIYMTASDLDGDGIEDIIISTGTSGQIVWHKNNNDPANRFSEAQTIEGDLSSIFTVKTADLDNDGDQDIVATSFEMDAVYWYENLNNTDNFSGRKTITTSADGAYDVELADYNNDGFIDIIATAFFDGDLLLFNNNGNKTFQSAINLNDQYPGVTRINSRDFNNDGDIDIAMALGGSNGLLSMANTSNNGTFNSPQVISRNNKYTIDISSGDIDGDGFLDLVAASYFDDGITWYRNNQSGSFQTSISVNFSASNPRKMRHADVDMDGNMDVITLSRDDHKLAWHRNLGGQNGFGKQTVISIQAGEGIDFVAADFNLDGKLDVISLNTQDSTILGFNSINELANSQRFIIDQTDGIPLVIVAEDINGDGLTDILIGQEQNNRVYWYENMGDFIFSDRKQIATNVDGVQHMSAGDLDNDGDIDIALPTRNDNTLFWIENLNGLGGFGVKRIIDNKANGIRWATIGDVDNDGDNDIIASLLESGSIVWYRNFSGSGNFVGPIVLASGLNGPWSIEVADYDMDNDQDIMACTFNGNEILYFENLDGNGSMSSVQVLKNDLNLPIGIQSADYDNDGDLDVFYTTVGSQEFGYFDNWTTNDCIADDFVIELSDCNDGLFDINIKSDYIANNINYQYIINSSTTGAISSTNGTTISSIDPLNNEILQVTIVNDNDSQCDETYNIAIPDCSDQCILTDVLNISGICNPDGISYSATIDFKIDFPLSSSFDLLIDNNYYGNYEYDEIPLELSNLPENFSGSSTITICDNDNDLCCISTEVASPCTCNYINITADIVDCDESLEEFYVLLDFTPINNGPNGFIIGGNSTTYGTYTAADLPILIGPLAADDTQYEFLISDAVVNFCFNFIAIGNVDCSNYQECEINNLDLTPLDCNGEGLFDLEVNFDVVNPISDSFSIEINGIFHSKYAYSTEPYIIENLDGDCSTLYNVRVIDNPSGFCDAVATLPNPICCSIETCEFTDIEILDLDCNNNQTISPRVSFGGVNTNGIQFRIYVDGLLISTNNYGQPSYPLGNLSANCITSHIVELVDVLDPDCKASIVIDPVCCIDDCGYSNLSVTTECLPGNDIHSISFDHPYEDNQTFSLSILNLDMGTYLYGDLPITIGFEIPQNMPIPFTIKDNSTQCDFTQSMPIICNSDCSFTELTLTPSECDDNLFDLTLEYKVTEPFSTTFNLFLNGSNIGVFQYNDAPVVIANLPADCETIYAVELIDLIDTNCHIIASLETAVCCIDPPCAISNILIDQIMCIDENTYSASFDMEHMSPLDDKFELYIDGVLKNQYEYNLLPLSVIDNIIIGQSTSQYVACDIISGCCDTMDIVVPDCAINCDLSNLVLSSFDCDISNNTFNADLNFEALTTLSNSFSIEINSQDMGTYSYDDLPIALSDINLISGPYNVIVQDLNAETCMVSLQLDSIPCTSNTSNTALSDIEIVQNLNQLLVTLPSTGLQFDATLFDITSKRVQSWNDLKAGINTCELPLVKPGVYILRLHSKKSIFAQKIIITQY